MKHEPKIERSPWTGQWNSFIPVYRYNWNKQEWEFMGHRCSGSAVYFYNWKIHWQI